MERHLSLTSPRAPQSCDELAPALLAHPRGKFLSSREVAVCTRLLMGYSNEAIALDLNVSFHSVRTYRRRAYLKLGVTSQNELFSLVLAHKSCLPAAPLDGALSLIGLTDWLLHWGQNPVAGLRACVAELRRSHARRRSVGTRMAISPQHLVRRAMVARPRAGPDGFAQIPQRADRSVPQRRRQGRRHSRTPARIASRRSRWARSSRAATSAARITRSNSMAPASAFTIRTATAASPTRSRSAAIRFTKSIR